jgi:hypothetical protein
MSGDDLRHRGTKWTSLKDPKAEEENEGPIAGPRMS